MDTSNFQYLGESSTPLNDFQAGEFARSSLLSSVALIETTPATFGSLVRITKDYRPEQIGQFGIIDYPNLDESAFWIIFSFGSDCYQRIEFEVVIPAISSVSLQAHLVAHLKTLLSISTSAFEVQHELILQFVAVKLRDVISLDSDGFLRSMDFYHFNAYQFLSLAYDDLTKAFKLGRRASSVFFDSAFKNLNRALLILEAVEVV